MKEIGWRKVTAKWPEIQRDKLELDDPFRRGIYIELRVATQFDGQEWWEKTEISQDLMSIKTSYDPIEVAFHQMERTMKDKIESEISARTRKMVEDILNRE
jgi:hypothetical protein